MNINFEIDDFFYGSFSRKGSSYIERVIGHEVPSTLLDGGVSNVSFLYKYVNVPPVAYGSPSAKIAESVLRSYENNQLPSENKVLLERQEWEDSDGPFPFIDKPISNFHPGALKAFAISFLLKYYAIIDRVTDEVHKSLCETSATILTTGRQTWDPIQERSVPSAEAYKTVDDILRSATNTSSNNCISFVRTCQKLLSLDSLRINSPKTEAVQSLKFNVVSQQREKVVRKRKRYEERTINGNKDVRKWFMDMSTSFCGYLKTMERGRLKTRAIASPNIILRMHLYVIEKFNLELGKLIESSTIAIGGEKKREKILYTMSQAPEVDMQKVAQLTEDKTKWNEGLSPLAFALMHDTFWNDDVRKQLKLPATKPFAQEIRAICLSGLYLLSRKRIHLGQGPQCFSETKYSNIRWLPEDKDKMNTYTKEWYSKLESRIDEDGYLTARFGMLMGMLNAASTTLACICVGYNFNRDEDVKTVISSDDSMTKVSATSPASLSAAIAKHYANLKCLGMTNSEKKNLALAEGLGEYTSCYMQGSFVSQYGTDTTKLLPGGKNPPDDIYGIVKGVIVALRERKFNYVGAEMAIALAAYNVRRLWRIELTPQKRGLTDNVLAFADGGKLIWNASNGHLNEMTVREHFAATDDDKKYLAKVMNPINPFSIQKEEQATYSHEIGAIVEQVLEVPRTVFTYVRRSNRSIKSSFRGAQILEQKNTATAVDIYRSAIPASVVLPPKSKRSMSDSVSEFLVTAEKLVSGSLNESEAKVVQSALLRLSGIDIEDDFDGEALYDHVEIE